MLTTCAQVMECSAHNQPNYLKLAQLIKSSQKVVGEDPPNPAQHIYWAS